MLNIVIRRFNYVTFVMPIAPTFSLYDVVPDPVPHIPASTEPKPSTKIPANNSEVRQFGNRPNKTLNTAKCQLNCTVQ